jgi:glycosyltransferase involved in cell wall biosynthesis
MARKFLLVTYHFPPSSASGSFRMLGLVRHLPRHGWEPVVVAPPTMPWEPADEALGRQVPATTTVFSAPYPTGFLTKISRKLLGPEPVWLPRGLAAARRAVRETKPEVVITSGPPHWVHYIGLYLKCRAGLGWVADLRDPWMPRGDVGSIWAKTTWADRHGEKQMMKHADAIISNAPLAQTILQGAYPRYADKIKMVTNGFDPESFQPVERSTTRPIRIVHTGELYVGRDPRTFLDALALLGKAPTSDRPIHAAFLGRNTGGKFDLDAEVTKRDLEAVVSVGGQVPYHQSLQDMAAADILLMLDGPGRKLGVPAKLYEYLGAGRPILALTDPDGDSSWVLRQSGLAHRIVAPPGNPEEIRQAICDLAAQVNQPKTPASLAMFTREHMAEQIAALLDGAHLAHQKLTGQKLSSISLSVCRPSSLSRQEAR